MEHVDQSNSSPAEERVFDAIKEQIGILGCHENLRGGWSPRFVREHALMIVHLTDALLQREASGLRPSGCGPADSFRL